MGEIDQSGGSLSLLYNSIFLTSALRLYHDATNHSSMMIYSSLEGQIANCNLVLKGTHRKIGG